MIKAKIKSEIAKKMAYEANLRSRASIQLLRTAQENMWCRCFGVTVTVHPAADGLIHAAASL
jgi:hypothetical protein